MARPLFAGRSCQKVQDITSAGGRPEGRDYGSYGEPERSTYDMIIKTSPLSKAERNTRFWTPAKVRGAGGIALLWFCP